MLALLESSVTDLSSVNKWLISPIGPRLMNPDGCITGEVIYFGKAQQVTMDGHADQRTTETMSDRYVSLLHREVITFLSSLGGGHHTCQDQVTMSACQAVYAAVGHHKRRARLEKVVLV